MEWLCLASRNPGKIREFRRMLEPLGVKLVEPRPDIPDPEEPFMTFRENAGKKASEIAAAMGMSAVADDSGIVVPALSGLFGFPFPGALSARLCLYRVKDCELVDFDPDRVPKEDRARRNSEMLIGLLHARSEGERAAHYGIHVAVADPDGTILFEVEARSPTGFLTVAPRGENGFGYDPYLIEPKSGRTYAELSPEEKDSISHRGRALRVLAQWCRDMGE